MITIDRTSFASRRDICRNPAYVPGPSGLDSAHWKELTSARRIIPVVGRTSSPALQRMIAGHVATAHAVFVSDDGDHLLEPLLEHWATFSPHVSVGGFYVVQVATRGEIKARLRRD